MLRIKRFSQGQILNTNLPNIGFTRGRKYDTDLSRLGKMKTAQRELGGGETLQSEMRKLNNELNNNLINKRKWQQDSD